LKFESQKRQTDMCFITLPWCVGSSIVTGSNFYISNPILKFSETVFRYKFSKHYLAVMWTFPRVLE